ncbi:MAG: sulfite exporter TauE/SafE family protein [bacterium]
MRFKNVATYALFMIMIIGVIAIIALNHGGGLLGRVQIGSAGWLVLVGAAFLTGYIDTCVGGGHGTMLTPILILLGFTPAMVVPAILLSEIGIGALSVILNHRAGNIQLARGGQHRQVLIVLAAASLIGSVIAVTVAVKLPAQWVNLYIGMVIVGVGLLLLTKPTFGKVSMKRIMALGMVAAFNKSLSGGGYGPLLTSGQVLSGVCEKGAVSITPPARGLTGLIAVVLYFMAKNTLEISLALPLALGSLLAMPVAVFTVAAIDAPLLRRGITLATLLLGILLVIKAVC